MFLSTGRNRALAAVALASSMTLVVAGCSSSGAGAGGGEGEDRVLNVFAGSQTPITANFNPYSPTALHASSGAIYETLYYYNKGAAGDPTPLLGESFAFDDTGSELTVTLKSGVTWSDGEPFTADDVVFTFEQPFASQEWITSVEAVDETTVKFVFDGPQYTNEFTVLGSTYIVPEHIWSTIEDTTAYADAEPVGTGPYIVDNVSTSAYTIVANPEYREEGKPAVKKVRYLGIDSNQSAEDLIRTGKIDWVSMFSPEPESITADGRMGYLPLYSTATVIYTCANAEMGCEGPQTDVAVRQAIDVALDRSSINEKAFAGVGGAASPTFALPGRDDQWVAPGMPSQSPQQSDVEAAQAILEEAGYAPDADGVYAKDGQRVEMTLVSVDGWNDYNSAAKLIAEQVSAAGIQVTATTVSQSEFADARQSGEFQLIIGGVSGTSVADPFQIYHDWFTTGTTAPVGEEVPLGAWNFSRYSDPEVDAAVEAASVTDDSATKLEAYGVIQEKIVEDLPYIPLILSASQTFYDTEHFTGWPTEDDLYAFPAPFTPTAAGLILSNLEPVG